MPPPYQQPHWEVFINIPYQPAGPVGRPPIDWVITYGLNNLEGLPDLPDQMLDRAEVREICQNPEYPVLYGYICAMAWGGQGAGGRGRYVVDSWNARNLIISRLENLRANNLNRRDAYNLFLNDNRVPGLGPAYFTKLLYFFSPEPTYYIMDQHTARSVNLLTGITVVRFAGDAVANTNKPGNYQAYCEELDQMSILLNVNGDQVEEMLMSKGGHNPWPWRAYVNNI